MGRKSRLKRERRRVREEADAVLFTARRRTAERFEEAVGLPVERTVRTPPGAKKMSEALLEFAEPLIEMIGPRPDARTLENLLGFATAIWNADLLGGRSADEVLAELREDMVEAGFEATVARGLLHEMLERRRRRFGDDRRIVGSHAVVENPLGGLQVTAAYVGTRPQAGDYVS